MTIVTQPTQLLHTLTSTMRDIPAENSANTYFTRYWREEVANSNTFRVDRVVCLTAGVEVGDGYGIGIEFGNAMETIDGIDNRFAASDTQGEALLRYRLQLMSLSRAEADSLPYLAPLDFTTDEAEVDAWIAAQYPSP